jgi:hypothetical protein
MTTRSSRPNWHDHAKLNKLDSRAPAAVMTIGYRPTRVNVKGR